MWGCQAISDSQNKIRGRVSPSPHLHLSRSDQQRRSRISGLDLLPKHLPLCPQGRAVPSGKSDCELSHYRESSPSTLVRPYSPPETLPSHSCLMQQLLILRVPRTISDTTPGMHLHEIPSSISVQTPWTQGVADQLVQILWFIYPGM